ncbi:Hypothetical protein EUBREC_2795 [Agathobacter rectalis ATCC 33656]|uniref:Uncharacterized protein n=1 Tax=Agathobacter rectalis (strain ATCC 33656 / DSM 3377 / JCM 17463 / KCTC 5835 / VPI 0990) TaxID=515619 RepID=C4ZHN8_AGARV|nr:Hypothetical protein EUBREC_2795 [Agathobacter rectalis ATCC 33656]
MFSRLKLPHKAFSKLYLFKKIQSLAYIPPSPVYFINSTFNFQIILFNSGCNG